MSSYVDRNGADPSTTPQTILHTCVSIRAARLGAFGSESDTQ